MMYPRGKKIEDELRGEYIAHAARVGAELGADVVKTSYSGDPDSFREVVEGCPVPVVIAGGPRTETEAEFLEMVANAIGMSDLVVIPAQGASRNGEASNARR